MRLFAPSEISLIKVQPVQNLAALKTNEKQASLEETKSKSETSKEVVYPVDETKNNFVKNTMDEQKNDSEDLVEEHLENAKQIADEEAKGDSENSNDSDQKADLEFEEAKASLDDVFIETLTL